MGFLIKFSLYFNSSSPHKWHSGRVVSQLWHLCSFILWVSGVMYIQYILLTICHSKHWNAGQTLTFTRQNMLQHGNLYTVVIIISWGNTFNKQIHFVIFSFWTISGQLLAIIKATYFCRSLIYLYTLWVWKEREVVWVFSNVKQYIAIVLTQSYNGGVYCGFTLSFASVRLAVRL